jgi:hypothetical protein
MACIAPSLVLTEKAASQFGAIAEGIVAKFYLENVGRPAFFPTPGSSKDFFDITHGFGNTSLYAAFLVANHPRLSPGQILEMSNDRQVKIPDLMTFDPERRTEFYEIKPNSASGIAKGVAKVAKVHALCQSFNLPYVPGVQWDPDTKVRLFSGRLMGIEVEVTFHFFRLQPGLIVYEICAEGRARPLTNREIAMIIGVVLIALLAELFSGGTATPALAPLLVL